jgi:hypothetical protein
MSRTTKNTSATDAVPPLTPEEWRLCKVAVTRALDSLAPGETQLGAQLTELYVRLRTFGGAAPEAPARARELGNFSLPHAVTNRVEF